ncbi:MAG: hypothetical protein AAFQ07_08430 [Chloroflexota bacterium]
MQIKRNALLIALVVALMSLVSAITYADQIDTVSAAQDVSASALAFDIAEDAGRFAFDDQNVFEDGMPAYGSAFVTQGYIYPAGTLNGSNGVLENGDPEFPDLVLGEWTCFGWMIGDGARTESGAWVVSTQVYNFNDGSLLITDGFELVDFNTPVIRAVTGGTYAYNGASGEMVQELMGFTEFMGVNLTVEFILD